MHRVLVISGTGFIGGHVVEGFVRRGARVTALVRSRARAEGDPRLRGATLAVGTVTSPPEETLDGPFDVVVYASGVWRRQDPSSAEEIAQRCREVYVEGVERFAARANAWKAHFIFMSGISRYGDAWHGTIDESTPPGKLSIYGAHKRKSEAILEKAAAQGLRYTALIPPEVYGSHDPGGYVRFVFERVRDRRFVLIGNGRNRWSLCNVRNVSDAVNHFADREGAGPMHVADATPTTQRDLAVGTASALRVQRRFVSIPRSVAMAAAQLNVRIPRPQGAPPPFSPAHVLVRTETLLLDTTRAARLGFHPRHDLKRGLEEAAAFWSLGPQA